VDRVAVRVVIDSYQIAIAPNASTENVEVQRFGWPLSALCGSRLPLHTLAVGGARITQHFGEYQSSELPPARSICRRLTSHQTGSDQVKGLFTTNIAIH
jgi:hypothetical protein